MKLFDWKLKMGLSTARSLLESEGFVVMAEKRLRDGHGTQLCLKNGAVVNVYDTRTVNVQGANRAAVEIALTKAVERQCGSLAALFADA